MQTLADAPMVLGPAKTRVVVRDVAYTTYLAFLYYVSLFFRVNRVKITIWSRSSTRIRLFSLR